MNKQPTKRKKAAHDFAVNAFRVVEEATSEKPAEPTKNPPKKLSKKRATALGRLGGAKGGPARAKKLTAEQRREIAKKAARTRWGNLP